MRYDGLRKRKRNEAVVAMREREPDLSLKEIGDAFGITRQRIARILLDHKNGKPKKAG